MEAKLILNYIFENMKPDFLKIIIDNDEYKIEDLNKKEIVIKFNEIEEQLGSKILEIKFINEYNQESYYCEILPGNNYGILFPYEGFMRDIIFPEDQVYKIKLRIGENKKELEIKNRLLFINYISICEVRINEMIFSKQILNANGLVDSLQICVADLDKRFLFNKEICPISYDDFFKKYEDNKKKANTFFNNIQTMMKMNLFTKKLYESYFNQNELTEIFFIKFNLPKVILQKQYNKQEYYDFISSCCLYYILSSIQEEKEIKKIYQYFIKYKERLEKDTNLEIYMRNMIMMEFALLLVSKKNLDNFLKINFSYYNIRQLEKDSPLYNAIEFLDNFIEDLNEKSPFIYPLKLIDSGNFTFGKKDVYGLGLITKDNLKSHLKNVLPDVIITINDEESKHDQASTNKALGSTILNLSSGLLSYLKNVELDKKVKEQDNNNITLILFLELFHELFGHKKGGYSQKTKRLLLSPNAFYDKQKKELLTLVDRNSQFASSNEIKILRDENSSDAGYFLEYFIGECEYGYYNELIEKMVMGRVNLNLILDNKLWNEKIEDMRKYLKLKYIIFKFNKNLFHIKKYKNIYEEITDLENIIIDKNIKLNSIEKIEEESKEEILTQRKRTEINSSDYWKQKEIKKYEKLSFDEIKEKMDNKETSPELRKILFNILLKRIRRK